MSLREAIVGFYEGGDGETLHRALLGIIVNTVGYFGSPIDAVQVSSDVWLSLLDNDQRLLRTLYYSDRDDESLGRYLAGLIRHIVAKHYQALQPPERVNLRRRIERHLRADDRYRHEGGIWRLRGRVSAPPLDAREFHFEGPSPNPETDLDAFLSAVFDRFDATASELVRLVELQRRGPRRDAEPASAQTEEPARRLMREEQKSELLRVLTYQERRVLWSLLNVEVEAERCRFVGVRRSRYHEIRASLAKKMQNVGPDLEPEDLASLPTPELIEISEEKSRTPEDLGPT